MEISNSLKRFALAVLKIACGISLATLILGLSLWAVVTFRDRQRQAADAPLANLRTWREVNVKALASAKFRLRTKWSDGKVYCQFDMQGSPRLIDQATKAEATLQSSS